MNHSSTFKENCFPLYEYFRTIGHYEMETHIQTNLRKILSSICDNFSKTIRLMNLFGSKSIVKSEFLKEIEVNNKISVVYNILQLWSKRSEELNSNFTNDILHQLCEIETNSVPIKHCIEQIENGGFSLIDYYSQIYRDEDNPDTSTFSNLMPCIIAISTDDILERKIPLVYTRLNSFEEDFKKTK